MRKLIFPFLTIIPLLIVSSCKIVNPDEEIPAYLSINSVTVSDNPGLSEGSLSSNIKDVWVYIDNDLQGIYQLPLVFPVLESGEHTIAILAGIENNGQSTFHIDYPFYSIYDTTITLAPSTTHLLNPVVQYTDQSVFALIEGFETGNDFQGLTTTNDNTLVFEGQRSGYVSLNIGSPDLVARSGNYVLPGSGTPVYLEMNYRNDANFEVYIASVYGGISYEEYLITVTKKEIWNKIYIDLTNVASSNPNADAFNILFKATKPDDVNEAVLLWDNVKIVTQ